MKKLSIFAIPVLALLASTVQAQKPKPTPAKPAKSIIFAVLNDGRNIEPIGYINRGKLETPVGGGDESAIVSAFVKSYYKTGTAYRLIFGGADAGVATVKSANAASECAKNIADVVVASTKVSLKGNRMALATNAQGNSKASAMRRVPHRRRAVRGRSSCQS